LPRVPRLELGALGQRRYAFAGPRRLFGYERVPGRVRFFLDDAIYADTARALLPEIGAYGAGLIDHLFRVELELTVQDGSIAVLVKGARGAASGEVRLFAEDGRGRRTQVGKGTLPSGGVGVGDGGEVRLSVSAVAPPGTRRIAAVLRGQDAAGELAAVVEQPLP
jgi:hypothetical protein